MTDKEKIIIDGVDVSKCYRYQKKTGYCKGAFKPEELPFCENFDCEFKKLARKTQECESLKEEIEVLKDNFDTATRDCNELIEELKQECEELKEENQQLRNNLSDSLMFRFTSQDKQINRYLKALEEVEEFAYCIKNFNFGYDELGVGQDIIAYAEDILDIIKKAKGEIMEIT